MCLCKGCDGNLQVDCANLEQNICSGQCRSPRSRRWGAENGCDGLRYVLRRLRKSCTSSALPQGQYNLAQIEPLRAPYSKDSRISIAPQSFLLKHPR